MDKLLCGRCRAPIQQDRTKLYCPKCGWRKSIGEQFAQPGTGIVLLETYSTAQVSDGARDGLLVSRAYVHESDLLAVQKAFRGKGVLERLQREFTTALAKVAGA